jgi:hypothetical protein|nr:MAG TPA: receptor binding complex [Crassvirales sp.]
MSFIINQNFDLKSPQFNFARDYFADVASLKAASENDFPDHFITNVGGVLYQLTKSNAVDTTTGKWRKLKLGSDVDLSGYATTTSLTNHINNHDNPHKVRKDQIGLGNVDNTSDANKPISEAVKKALGNKVDSVTGKGLSTNDFTTAYKTKLDNIAEYANNYTLKKADDLHLGGIKVGYRQTTTGAEPRNYPVELDVNDKAFVNVPWKNTEYNPATTSANGLMSSTDKTKLDSIATNATRVIVDDTLSTTSSNAVKNSLVTTKINDLRSDLNDVGRNVTTLQSSVNAITSITTKEITDLFK